MFAEDLEMEEDTHGLSESENESIYTEDSFVEHDEGENDSEDWQHTCDLCVRDEQQRGFRVREQQRREHRLCAAADLER